jgi:hypothetical protein
MSFDDILSPCETYEGSRHYHVTLGDAIEVPEGKDPLMKETVVMSPALLADLQAALREQVRLDPPQERPTRRSMPATKPPSTR